MGPDGAQSFDVYLRNRDLGRRQRLGQFRPCENAGLSLGHLSRGPRSQPRDRLRRQQGKPALAEVPGELRTTLRRLIVTQGDTEPASVEQQRMLGKTAPSLYDPA